ncbi:hypothetical protein [Specibacter sp. RAF43]|uniref:hypothetical protein n=1 Tax=Specibacter sp. RAF43 TaxID=3233057 RepID=UPI003F95ACB8
MGPLIRPAVLYSGFSRLLAVLAWLFCAFFAVNLLLTGTWESIRHFLPWLMLVAWALYVLLWRPCLVVRADGLEVINLLREHRVPFAALTAVQVHQGVTLVTTAGRLASWGAPGAGRPAPMGSGKGGPSGPRGRARPLSQARIQSAWDAWEAHRDEASADVVPSTPPDPRQAVTSRWNRPAVVVTLALAALVAASVLR